LASGPKAPTGVEIKVWGGTKEQVQNNNLGDLTIWQGKVNAADRVMILSRQFREGTQHGGSIDYMYPNNAPVADRIKAGDHLAKTWKNYGDGQPLKKLGVTDIKTDKAKAEWNSILSEKRANGIEEKKRNGKADDVATSETDAELASNGVKLRKGDPAFERIMATSAGKPLESAMKWHPEVFHHYEVSDVTIFQKDGQYAIFNLVPPSGSR